MRCEICKWFESITPFEGECRKNAPLPYLSDKLQMSTKYAAWPLVRNDLWCGEYKYGKN